jgi:hypothetical protein
MMLENCCYDFFELLTLNMARQGFFGEIIHGKAPISTICAKIISRKDGYAEMWRLKENTGTEFYPTHGWVLFAKL